MEWLSNGTQINNIVVSKEFVHNKILDDVEHQLQEENKLTAE